MDMKTKRKTGRVEALVGKRFVMREAMGQCWISDTHDAGRLLAMITERENAILIEKALNAYVLPNTSVDQREASDPTGGSDK